MKNYLSIFVGFFFLLPYANTQCGSVRPSLSKKADRSSIIIEGKVLNQFSFWDDAYALIYTQHEVEIYKVFKGKLKTATLNFVTLGGKIDGQILEVYPSLKIQKGQTGILFLKNYEGNRFGAKSGEVLRPVASGGTFIPYSPDLKSAKDGKTIFPNLTDLYDQLQKLNGQPLISLKKILQKPILKNGLVPTIDAYSPGIINAGTEEILTITGTGFGTETGTVFFTDADNGGAGLLGTSTVISWADTEIQLIVPENVGIGPFFIEDSAGTLSAASPTDLNIFFNQNTVNGIVPELIDDNADGDGGYRFFYSAATTGNGVAFANHQAAIDALERAADTWTANTNIPLYVGQLCGTTDLQTPQDDGVNIIAFDNDNFDLGTEVDEGALGVTFIQAASCGPSGIEILGLDLIFRRDINQGGSMGAPNWNFGPANPTVEESDFESVAVHELGHAQLLGHLINPGEVMHFALAPGEVVRTLTAGAIAGSAHVMAHSQTYDPPIIPCCCGGDFDKPRQAGNFVNINEINTWTAGGDGVNWNDAANWSDGIIPLECQEVLIPTGSQVTVPASFEALGKTLEVELGGILTMEPQGEMSIGNE